jgi:oxamate amidohydrolase
MQGRRTMLALNGMAAPPPTQGIVSLEMLNILARAPMDPGGDGSPAYYHLMVEAAKQAFADRDAMIADPDYVLVPVDALLSVDHAAAQRAAIEPERARPAV